MSHAPLEIPGAPAIEVLYRNFDGLDLSLQGALRRDLVAVLDLAKAEAQKKGCAVVIDYRGVRLSVAETGAPHGYAFRCDTGDDGATWFFKRSMNPADWNMRVSVKSMALALYGLGGVRARLYEFLAIAAETIGIESLSRVDYAVDLLLPAFVLVPEHFVMHSHCDRRDHVEPEEMAINGKSGRVTSVTVGHMPRRELIVYDKRAEVIQKHKVHWWEIWNAGRRPRGLPELDPKDRRHTAVWRVEARAGKEHLKGWGITRWSDLDAKAGDMLTGILKAIRYTVPFVDSNRSRWPDAPIWQTVRDQIAGDLFEMTSGAAPVRVKQVRRNHLIETLSKQITGTAARGYSVALFKTGALNRSATHPLAGAEP